jgi:toxin ParE1/3/4
VQIDWLSRALRNLQAEAEYIVQDNPVAAAQVVLQIEKAVELLRTQPAIGRPGRVHGTRELVVSGTPYIVPYRVRGQRIQILRVFHARRKWPSSL